jgi:ubiquinone/menaquinone biosynthesis C-methylase UbiE
MSHWPLPKRDPWSTPFAQVLLDQLQIAPGMTILDIACGSGIPAFNLAEQVGPSGHVSAIDVNQAQLTRARAIQGASLPWLEFSWMDMKALPETLPMFDRITGNLSVMFFRPDRFTVLKNVINHLVPNGQIVLTFPALGTFDSLWDRIDQEMATRHLHRERQRLADYRMERPSAEDAEAWLTALQMKNIIVKNFPLEVHTGPGQEFLYHPLLRGGFLEDVFECFEDQPLANAVMNHVAQDLNRFLPLIAQRCVMSGWKPG